MIQINSKEIIDNIGLILVLEEDNMNYLSEYTPKYNVIEVLKQRAKYHNAKILFSSNTPKIETYYKYYEAKYSLLKYRINNKCNVEMVDMRDEVLNNYDIISRKLEMRINEVLENNRQVMLILDNKGYSSTITCRRCKKTVKCPKCQISLTYYKETGEAKCKYCGQKFTNLSCTCGSTDFSMDSYGLEKVKEVLENKYPGKSEEELHKIIWEQIKEINKSFRPEAIGKARTRCRTRKILIDLIHRTTLAVFEDVHDVFYEAVNQILNRMAFNQSISVNLVVLVATIVFTFILIRLL